MSFLNGLSALGTSTAAYASTAGLEAQKADLAKQSLVLADQLATTRESAGRQEAAGIAATAQNVQNTYQSSESLLNRQSQAAISAATNTTSLGVAGIGAASAANVAGISAAASKYSADVQSKGLYAQLDALEPTRQAAVLQTQQQTALAAVQTQNATDLRGFHTALADEVGKPTPDPDKVASLKSQITSSEASAQTDAATTTAAAAVYKTDLESVQHINGNLVAATSQLNQMEMSDTGREAQKALVASLQRQLNGANIALDYSSKIAHGRVAAATGSPPSGGTGDISRFNGPAASPAAAPVPAPAGMMNQGTAGRVPAQVQ